MIGEATSAPHDAVISGVLDARAGVSMEDAAACCLTSLTSRRLDLRTALGSAVLARRLEPHAVIKGPSRISGACAVCGLHEREVAIDWDVMNFERFTWGGVPATT